MSKLDELISQLCPEGVEYKRLEEICNISRGRVMSKDYLRENSGEYPVYSSQTASNGIFGYINSYDYDFESITWTTDGANAGSVFYHFNEKFSITNVCGLLRLNNDEIMTKFLFYALKVVAQTYVNAGMGNPKLMSNVMAKVSIPIPPLPVQEEIVRLLDKFTALEAELEVKMQAELEARRKQYEYYKDLILREFDNNYINKTINQLCLKTKNISWNEISSEATFKYIDLSSVDRDTHTIQDTIVITYDTAPSRAQKVVMTHDIIFGTTRPTLKRYCIVPNEFDGHICSTGFCVLRADKTKILPKYLYYQISKTEFYDYMETVQRGSAYPAVSDRDVRSFKIPLPPLAEQERIVAILDRFDSLVNAITQGLPAEIEARRKQYEYCRDKLLTFEEVSS